MQTIAPFTWRQRFADELRELGATAHECRVRLSMHPDQFVLINSPKRSVVESSVRELLYHAELLDAIDSGGAPSMSRIQVHVGGLYGDRAGALRRFCDEYRRLPASVRSRLVVENDDRLFGLADCLQLHRETGVPVLLDTFHHECLNRGEPLEDALVAAAATWPAGERPMVDYSEQQHGARRGAHAESLTPDAFRRFLQAVRDSGVAVGLDVMLEIKDKEASALQALTILQEEV